MSPVRAEEDGQLCPGRGERGLRLPPALSSPALARGHTPTPPAPRPLPRGRVHLWAALSPGTPVDQRLGLPCPIFDLMGCSHRGPEQQPTIFQNKKKVLLGETGKEKLPRYYKSIRLGFKTPKKAIEDNYINKKCSCTGNVSIPGRILSGVVTKLKMQRTVVIRRDYIHYIHKYNRFKKCHKSMSSVHLSPCSRDDQIRDIVTMGECQPMSKIVLFSMLKVAKQFEKF
ncbi:PREDICTED: 40S ribosomal protein S11-like [Elephantulus edwardii]|uniref:40S ribosomal protein S11-like n=1 Tax=Elephantulus edwardii TaxID=28737 RepID=UPI0003F0F279|nr:PREDICTED: 40S ribosomal protein S11-like [Elephantulus edwardii]